MRKRSSIIAAALLVCALGLWFGAPRLADRFTTPLRGSLPAISGQHAVFSFTPWLSQRHYIEIEFARNLPFSRLQQIVGPLTGEPTSRPTIDVAIQARGQRVTLQSEHGTSWGSLVGFTLCSFPAVRGERYTLTADVRAAEPDLQKLNGQIFVTVDPLTGESYYFRVLAARLAAILLLIAAVFVFFIGVAYRRGLSRGARSGTSLGDINQQT